MFIHFVNIALFQISTMTKLSSNPQQETRSSSCETKSSNYPTYIHSDVIYQKQELMFHHIRKQRDDS